MEASAVLLDLGFWGFAFERLGFEGLGPGALEFQALGLLGTSLSRTVGDLWAGEQFRS